MAGDVRQGQNQTQPTPCGRSPVSATTVLKPSSLQPNGTTIHNIAIKQKCGQVSKLTSSSQLLPGSANASPTPDAPAMSHSTSMSHHTLSTNQTVSPSTLHPASPASAHTPTSPPSKPSESVKNPDTLEKSLPPAAQESSSPVANSTLPEAAPVPPKPKGQQGQPAHDPSLQLPGLAAANPPGFSKPIEVEAAPSTTSPPVRNPPAGEAAAQPVAQPESANPAEEDEDSGEPPAGALAPTQSSGQDKALPSEILNPGGASDPADLSSAPSTLTTDISSAPSRIAVTTSVTSDNPASSGPASDIAAPTVTNSVGSAAPTKTPPGSNLQLQTNHGGSGPPMGMIIGAAVGGAAALAILALLIWMWRRRANKKKELGRPLTPLTSPGHQPADAAEGPFAAGRQASTRAARHPLHGWWTSHGVNHDGAPAIPPEHGEKQPSTNLLDENPFSDTHSTEAQRTAPILTPHQQQLRGILKQPAGAMLHSRHPSNAPSIGAAGAGQRSRAHSISDQRGRPPSQPQQQRPAASRRTSSLTQDPFDERRTKFRSDPFDLELDTRMLSSSSSSQRSGDARASSVYSAGTSSSSRYTSGVSSTAWTAEHAAPGGGGRPGASDSPTLPLGPRGYVGVGQAM
ncbi:hypothetical protein CCM_01253 [Cordyceps militaris CM01]|uniref:Uncharacterized protein n=2 Tax=Cordyceps militaris TaxID=73501 RepID=G3J424_CORMM|nr:uncharacterized protein CCM_01253 [Cordyceps militaris CM01]ATY64733.1 hypothetical protein A9K55_005075 [Cordyceps militaris]EGX96595.1 hypothetical protein CCM_01253 [Cordyceps militaris CM01]